MFISSDQWGLEWCLYGGPTPHGPFCSGPLSLPLSLLPFICLWKLLKTNFYIWRCFVGIFHIKLITCNYNGSTETKSWPPLCFGRESLHQWRRVTYSEQIWSSDRNMTNFPIILRTVGGWVRVELGAWWLHSLFPNSQLIHCSQPQGRRLDEIYLSPAPLPLLSWSKSLKAVSLSRHFYQRLFDSNLRNDSIWQ